MENPIIIDAADLMSGKTSIPKLEKLGMNLWIWLIDNPHILFLIVAVLLILLFAYPVDTIVFFISVAFSTLMGVLMYKLTYSKTFNQLALTSMEKTVISGATAGVTGFIIGQVANRKLDRVFH